MRTSMFLTTLALLATTGAPTWANLYDHGGRSVPRDETSKAKPNCQSVLGNQSFSCHVKSSFGGEFDDCFQFFSPGFVSDNFDLVVLGLDPSEHLGCSCTATGSLKKPKFGAGKGFVCTGELGISFAGNVAGNGSKTKIKKGFTENIIGDSFVYECTVSATPCGASPSGAFIDDPLAY